MWVRGLKLMQGVFIDVAAGSHPMWVRGLKLGVGNVERQEFTSHPMWARGLKQIIPGHRIKPPSRTLYGCVD